MDQLNIGKSFEIEFILAYILKNDIESQVLFIIFILEFLKGQLETLKNFSYLFALDEEATAHDLENLLKLPTRWGDTVSPGSSAKLADGAAACVLMNENGIQKYTMNFYHNSLFILYFISTE